MQPQRADYGIDAPKLVFRFALIGIAGILVGFLGPYLSRITHNAWLEILAFPAFWIGGTCLATAGIMVWGSRFGKMRLGDRILSSIPWRGDEQVLDVGCGRGLMLIGAAKRLTTGHAFGIDIWQTEDQSGNSAQTTLCNCQLEEVVHRVTLRDCDARTIDFPDATFDVVLSSWAIHNIYDAAGREQAVREIHRVLKPGGRLVIVDIKHINEYAAVLKQCSMQNLQKSGPNFLFAIPTHTLTAQKALT